MPFFKINMWKILKLAKRLEIFAPYSGHYIGQDQPRAIDKAINEMAKNNRFTINEWVQKIYTL